MEELFRAGSTFHEFVNKDKDTHKEKTLQNYHRIEVDEKLENQIKEVDETIYILVFGEIWCPDCMINVPALQKMADINEKIIIRIVSREGNEGHMHNYSVNGKPRIPTFVVMNQQFQEKGTFIEQPQTIKDIVAKGNQAEIIVARRKYQKGEYTNDTIKEVLGIIKQL
jgi:thiol-disulfide isomerase/thioredoxin